MVSSGDSRTVSLHCSSSPGESGHHFQDIDYQDISLPPQLPELMHSKEKGVQKVIQVVMILVGMAIGFSILLVIALFEDSINFVVN